MINFLEEARTLFDYTRSLRRDFHRHPELGFKERRTSGIVAHELKKLGYTVQTGIAETGVLGLLEGNKSTPVVLARFDMDALPIHEATVADYASKNAGVMHACGHDGHMAMGLTIARIIAKHRSSFAGTVKFVFQPAEELLSGAKRMVSEEVLQNPRPDYALAMHLWNFQPTGYIGIPTGPAMAGGDSFRVVITGKGGHGAIPHLAKDPILASAHSIAALQSIVSRNVDALDSAVVSVTSIQGGDAFNVIPEKVELKGTIRTFKTEVRREIITRFKKIISDTASSLGCTSEIEMNHLTPAIVNDAQLSKRVAAIAKTLFPDEVIDNQFRSMASEDMAYMMADIPGCYFFIGANSPNQMKYMPHHDPNFNFDEDALLRGVALMTAVISELLNL